MSRTRAGYTLIEIMTAVVVMTIGATGIIAMQGASVRSNQDANETATAVNFATTWLERIKRDARLWTATGQLGNTTFLGAFDTTPDTYFVPVPTNPLESFGADYFGFETRDQNRIQYCINLRLSAAHVLPAGVNALRADVRVWWHRASADAARTSPTCTAADGALQAAHLTSYRIRKHYLSTVVTWRQP